MKVQRVRVPQDTAVERGCGRWIEGRVVTGAL